MAKKILVVGGGGREHAIIKALKKSPDCGEIWCAPGNGGISYDAKCKNIKATDVETMVAFAAEEKFDYVVVAQDDPLALGMVDALAAVGIPAFGPDKAAARIEASKVFSKDLMKKYGIPTADYATFDDPAKVMGYIKAKGKYPVVIKADGLALGKGVLICENEEQAADGVKEIMLDKKFGASGNHVVVEEFLTGPEVSVLSFTDGKVVKPMVSSMDHKRANDHDTGLNTGGMGTIAPNPYYTPEVAAECMEKIFLPTIKATRGAKLILGIPNNNVRKQYYEYLIELMDAKAYVNVNKLTDYYYDMAYEGKWHEALQYMADSYAKISSVRDGIEAERNMQGFFMAYLSLNDYYYTAPELELSHGYCDFFLLPDLTHYEAKHSYIIELKMLPKKDFNVISKGESKTKAELQWDEAVEQINRYAAAPRVEVLRQGTQLHKIIMQFEGWELKNMKEV